ncbi:hypothetical protein AAH994_15590 [Weeksellaceae bacterium A-14]
MRIKKLLLSFFLALTLISCSKILDDAKILTSKTDLKKIKDSIKNSINDSIAKSDSTKIVVGIAKLNKKTKVILYDNFKWKYQNSTDLQNKKKAKTTERQVQTLMQTFEPNETQYVSSGVCGALTKKGGSCQRRVEGGGRCWQH